MIFPVSVIMSITLIRNKLTFIYKYFEITNSEVQYLMNRKISKIPISPLLVLN